MVEEGHLFGEADRVVQRRLKHGETEAGMAQTRGQRAGEPDRVGINRDAVEMVFGEPNDVDAELVGEMGLADRLVDHDAVMVGVAAVGKQEVGEFHADAPSKPRRISGRRHR